ncbi:TPA: type II toxin-antitoxin system RelE/ParE family toxin [Candidatus Bathyarchaeota archaeon]|nr:type II toxin-antitoxin system RelE/ParE family toxin [Candidatus Bathyarchaeota archaeon]
MNYRGFLHPEAAEFLRKLSYPLRKKIKDRLRELGESPGEKGQRLKHSLLYRLRIGDYRAIYEIRVEEGKVIVLFIGHRRTVYDDFSRLL